MIYRIEKFKNINIIQVRWAGQVRRAGYILPFTLMCISVLVWLLTYMFNTSSVFVPFARMSAQREKAVVLAQSGLQLAISQLAHKHQDKKDENKQDKKDIKKGDANTEQLRALYQRILPTLNHWQTVQLTAKHDGIDATIEFCISSEDGKININSLYNYKKKEFIDKDFVAKICGRIEKQMQTKGLVQSLDDFFKKNEQGCQDITELLLAPGFEVFNRFTFYEPNLGKGDTKPFYLTDIFTIYTQKDTLDPWLLSDSMCGILECTRASSEKDDIKKRKTLIKKALKEFKVTHDWQIDWDILLDPIYSKKFNQLPREIQGTQGQQKTPTALDKKSKLSHETRPTVFSVMVRAKVGKVVQKMYAILDRSAVLLPDAESFSVTVKKLYWI